MGQWDEFSHYRDDGCSLAPSCLACPLPACRYDMPPKRAGMLLRLAEIEGLLASGLSRAAAAERMAVSTRTISRFRRILRSRTEGEVAPGAR